MRLFFAFASLLWAWVAQGIGGLDVLCIYYPEWHVYPEGEAIFGKGRTEWDYVDSAKPRFPGHEQPLRLLDGHPDDANPADVAKEIDYAADAGIDCFVYDWYWADGHPIQHEALERGFLKAPNRRRLKFALMWANHWRSDVFRTAPGKCNDRFWWKLKYDRAEFLEAIDYCIAHYFNQPEYYLKDGRVFLSIYSAHELVKGLGGPEKTKAVFDEAQAKMKAAGLPPLHLSAMVRWASGAKAMAAAGFDSTSAYNITPYDFDDSQVKAETGEKRQLFTHEEFAALHETFNAKIASGSPVPYIPVVSRGWDPSPRCRLDEPFPWKTLWYPYLGIIKDLSSDCFARSVALAKRQAENDPKKPGAILINAWNEYTEGSYLMPDEKNGDAYLKALRRALGVPPKACSLGAVAGCGNDRGGTSEQDQAAYGELTREGGLEQNVCQPFVSARPVWAKGSEREQNVFLRFRSSFACPDGRVPVLRIASSSIYRVKLNGRFVGCGPARTSKGCACVDEWTLSAVSNGVNGVEIDVCSYNVPESFQYLAEPGFLQTEIVADGKALVATPTDFAATVLPRSTAQPFYSHQRRIPVERWTVAAEEKACGVEVVPAPKLLPRMAPYPAFRVRSAQRREGADGLAYDFPFVDTGFPGVKVCCRKPGRITLRFEEALTAGRLNLHRNGDPATSWHAMHNFVTWDVVKPGVYDLESIEPYSMKHVEVSFENDCGRLLSAPWIRQYRNPHLEQVAFHSSDPEIDAIFAAACNSFAMNAVDLYTDCPSRERSAWLCDSHFTAMAADWLTGDNSIEGSQLENFARTTDYPGLPPGGMSGLYPGNRLLPTYMMWYVLQCTEHVARAGADAERFRKAVRDRVLENVAFLQKFENADGLLENLPGWIFVEWSKANDFTTGVNYPVNALWSAALESAGRLFARPDLVKKADAVRGTIRRQSFDGRYFRDHALRDAQGALTVKDEKSETCQYYQFCFGVVSRDSHPELWDRMATGFGPGRTSDGLQPSDMFFGQLLRLDLLGRYGRYEQELAEIRHYFGKMAKESGALWEFADGHDSRCHGFGSFVAVLLLRDILGVKEINVSDKYVSVSSATAPIENATAIVRTADGLLTFRLSRSGERSLRDASLPPGWTLRRLDAGKAVLAPAARK